MRPILGLAALSNLFRLLSFRHSISNPFITISALSPGGSDDRTSRSSRAWTCASDKSPLVDSGGLVKTQGDRCLVTVGLQQSCINQFPLICTPSCLFAGTFGLQYFSHWFPPYKTYLRRPTLYPSGVTFWLSILPNSN